MAKTTASYWLLLAAACLVSAAHGYRYIGCYVDSGHRDLPVLARRGSVSIGICNGLCGARNYRYFGLQNSDECWCGSSYGRYGSRSSHECNKRCTGDSSAKCGAGWRNSVYATEMTPRMAFMGCFADTGRRDLPVLAGTGSMRVSLCYQLCRQRSYVYFGVQAANECWCGNRFGAHGVKPTGECNSRCTGDATAVCGAGWRNSVYTTGLDPVGHHFLSNIGSSNVKGQIQAAIKSQYSTFPGGVLCFDCLITGWSRQEVDVKSKVFHVSQLDSYMRGFPSKAQSKVQVLKFGANAKTTFEDYHFSVGHSHAERKSYIGVARRVGSNVELGMIAVDLTAPLVAKYNVYHKKTCKKILWVFKKCKTHTIRHRRGYHTSEVNLLDRALRSETFRLFAEKSNQLTV